MRPYQFAGSFALLTILAILVYIAPLTSSLHPANAALTRADMENARGGDCDNCPGCAVTLPQLDCVGQSECTTCTDSANGQDPADCPDTGTAYSNETWVDYQNNPPKNGKQKNPQNKIVCTWTDDCTTVAQGVQSMMECEYDDEIQMIVCVTTGDEDDQCRQCTGVPENDTTQFVTPADCMSCACGS